MAFVKSFVYFLSVQILLVFSQKDCVFNSYYLRYYKIRSCYKSNLGIVAWKNVLNVYSCMQLARNKRALAFNYSPPEAKNSTRGYFKNCQVLDCPEIGNSTTLVPDVVFDYYSAFGNATTIENTTCINSLGLFAMLETKQNYTNSIISCQNIGADLADILTERRTNALALLLKQSMQQDWYKAAYVGLDDSLVEGNFETSSGLMLGCTKFRAWAPGHPRSKHRNEDCVALDADKTWRTVRCGVKLAAVCEFYPNRPWKVEAGIKNVTCSKIKGRRERKLCLKDQELFNLYHNSSRMDQCALIQDIYL